MINIFADTWFVEIEIKTNYFSIYDQGGFLPEKEALIFIRNKIDQVLNSEKEIIHIEQYNSKRLRELFSQHPHLQKKKEEKLLVSSTSYKMTLVE